MIDRIAQLEQRQQIMLGALALGVLFLFWYYPLRSVGAEVETLEGRVQQLTNEVQRGQVVQAQLPRFQKEVEELELRLDELKDVLPDQKETAEIVRRVEELAVESNLDIKSFAPQATIRSNFYEDWPIRIALEGSYNNLGIFFQKIANFTRIINVDNIEIRALSGQRDADRTISATCTATTFVFVEETPARSGGGR